MIRSRSRVLSWFLAHLVGGNKKRMESFGALRTHIRPTAVFITVVKVNASRDVTLGDDCSAAGFIIRDRCVLAAPEFDSGVFKDCSCGGMKCLTDMVLVGVDFVFYDALDVNFETFLIATQKSNLVVNVIHTQVIDVFGCNTKYIFRFGKFDCVAIEVIVVGERDIWDRFCVCEQRIHREWLWLGALVGMAVCGIDRRRGIGSSKFRVGSVG